MLTEEVTFRLVKFLLVTHRKNTVGQVQMLVSECHFKDGQTDGAIGIYRPPHNLLKAYFVCSKQAREKMAEENEAYKSGFKLARKKIFKSRRA